MIAEGYNEPLVGLGGEVQFDSKYYYSQDAVKWVDLQAIDNDTTARAARVTSMLLGDPAKNYEVLEDDDTSTQPAEGEETGGKKQLAFQVPELAVLRTRVDDINASCGVIPVVRGMGLQNDA